MRIFGSISRLVSILFRKDGQDLTVRPNQATTYTVPRDFQLPEGDADAELVGKASTQTLTNKTISGTSNTLSNIPNAATTATSANTPSTIVSRDVGGDFSAGTITAALSGNASTATTAGNVTGIVAIANGGTNSSAALSGSRVMVSNGSGAIVEAAAITVQRVLVSDASGYPVASGTSDTELGYLTGVTSAIQGQLDAKASITYVDNAINGLSWKSPVAVATTANITLSGEQTIDGVLTSNSRVLVKDQSTASQNGIYVSATGAWARAVDMDSLTPLDEVNGAACFVLGGTVGGDKAFVQTATVATLGTDALAFAQFSSASSYVGGTGITITGNSIATNDGAIVHDNLSGFVANEHIDHSAVSITTSATSGLSGGGDLTATRSPVVAPDQATVGTVAAADEILFADVSAGNALRKTTAADIAALAAGSAAQAFTWTDGSATKVCTHTFGTDDVLVELYDSTSKETVYADFVDRTGTNEVTVTRSEATVGSNWRVVIRN